MLKLYVVIFISDVAAYRVVAYTLFSVQGGYVDWPVSIPPCTEKKGIHKHMICCHITDKYNDIFTILTCNFSKEKYVIPEDDLRIETCKNIPSVLM
jgi:hypothetical protein